MFLSPAAHGILGAMFDFYKHKFLKEYPGASKEDVEAGFLEWIASRLYGDDKNFPLGMVSSLIEGLVK